MAGSGMDDDLLSKRGATELESTVDASRTISASAPV